MSYLHRVTPNKETTAHIEGKYNTKGQLVDANTKEILVQGKIDRGHKHGYEERVMRKCAERCHMTQKEYNKMMQNSKLYQYESSHNNRTHKYESKDRMLQLHNCFEVIRDYKGKNRNKTIEKYGKSDFTYSKQIHNAKNYNSFQKTSNNISFGKNVASKVSNIATANASYGQISKSANNGLGNSDHGGAGVHGGISGIASGGHEGASSSGGHGGHGGASTGGGHGR